MKKIFLAVVMALCGTVSASAGTVLFIGDSHSVGPFGLKLDGLLRGAGHKTATYASCGSIAEWWVTGRTTHCGYFFRDLEGNTENGQIGATPIFGELLAKVKPDAVIVELGANYANTPSDELAVKDMRAMAEKIKASGAACFWVATPDFRRGHDQMPRILNLTHKAVADICPVFDSTKVTAYPGAGGDGVHYSFEEGMPIADAWAQHVFEWFASSFPSKPR